MRLKSALLGAVSSLVATMSHAQSIPFNFQSQSGFVSAGQLDSNFSFLQNAANLTGTLPPGRLPAFSGDCSTVAGASSLVCLKTNGVPLTTAATTSLGTSGATIPLLNGANTWSGSGLFTGGLGWGSTLPAGSQFVNSYNGRGVPGIQINNQGNLDGAALSGALNIGRNLSNGGATSDGSSDIADVYIERNAAYTGGTVGFVNSGLRVVDTIGANAASFEWAILGVAQNSATGGENVAVYGQGNRLVSGGGPTWGGVMEARETVATNNPSQQLIGLEVDNRSNGTDNNHLRIGLMVVGAQNNTAGAATSIQAGVEVIKDSASPSVTFNNGYLLSASGSTGFNVGGTWVTGVDTENATISGSAFSMAAGQNIAFDCSAQTCTRFLSFTGGALTYHTPSGNVYTFADAGTFSATNVNASGATNSTTYNIGGIGAVVSAAGFQGAATFSTVAVGPGAGTGPTGPSCVTSHRCDQFSGEFLLTTGTAPAAGTIATINLTTSRTNIPNCVVGLRQNTSPPTPLLVTPVEATGSIGWSVSTALTASTAYTLTYVCGGE